MTDLKTIRKKIYNEIFEQCHSAEKRKRGDLLGFFDIPCVAKYRNKGGKVRRPFGGIQKFSKNVALCRKNPSEKPQIGASYVFKVLYVDVFVLDEVLGFRVCFGRP